MRAAPIPADVLRPEDARRFVEAAAAQLGGIDILINNVGFGIGKGLVASSDEDWVGTFEYNVFQGVRLTRLVVPHMQARGGGSVVFISSISGWIPQLSGTPQYGASKAAQIFMAEPLALELVHDRIRVNVVSPGSILFEGEAGTPFDRGSRRSSPPTSGTASRWGGSARRKKWPMWFCSWPRSGRGGSMGPTSGRTGWSSRCRRIDRGRIYDSGGKF